MEEAEGGSGSWRGSQQLVTSCLSLKANFGAERGVEGERKRFRSLCCCVFGGDWVSASLFTEFRLLEEEEAGSQVRAERECMQEYMGMITKVNTFRIYYNV